MGCHRSRTKKQYTRVEAAFLRDGRDAVRARTGAATATPRSPCGAASARNARTLPRPAVSSGIPPRRTRRTGGKIARTKPELAFDPGQRKQNQVLVVSQD